MGRRHRLYRISSNRRPYGEYLQFEKDPSRRLAKKQAFMEGVINAPHYKYPNLNDLMACDGKSVVDDERRELQTITSELAKDRAAGLMEAEELDLYLGSHERSFKQLMLAQAALLIQQASTPAEQKSAQREFTELNRELYGDVDDDIFSTIMYDMQERVASFCPVNSRAHAVKRSLDTYFLVHRFQKSFSSPHNTDLLKELQSVVRRRYAPTLSAVPDSDDSVIYDARQCQVIMQRALDRSGIGTNRWTVEIDELRDVPSADRESKRIVLPGQTYRTASQLRRLILHEQEVHARRAENGASTGLGVLFIGTPTYGGVEEGLGVLLECADTGTFDNPSYYRAHDRYITAGVALGLDGKHKDARATFSLIWRLIALRSAQNGVITKADVRRAKAAAVEHIDNAFRGTNFIIPGVAYLKLKIYYEGLLQNIRYFQKNRDDIAGALDRALIGKYNHTNKAEAEQVYRLIESKSYSAARQLSPIA